MNGETLGIGIIGFGAIAQRQHVPAYQRRGLPVIGIADPSKEARRQADTLGIHVQVAQYHDLLHRDDIHVVDVATPSPSHFAVVKDCLEAGKHVLCQKPFVPSLQEANILVSLAESKGLKLAVNQTGRWVESIECAKGFLENGDLGEWVACTVENRGWCDVGRYYFSMDKFMILEVAVHHIDILRYLLGNPQSVFAVHAHNDGHPSKGENVAYLTLQYPNGKIANLVEDWSTWGPPRASHPHGEIFWFSGTEGSMMVQGMALELRSKHHGDRIHVPDITRAWFPDAFEGPMLDLMESIVTDREPRASGRDNIHTLRVILAAYLSAEEHRPVGMEEIQ